MNIPKVNMTKDVDKIKANCLEVFHLDSPREAVRLGCPLFSFAILIHFNHSAIGADQ